MKTLWDRIAQARRHYIETGHDALGALIDAGYSALRVLPADEAVRMASALAPFTDPYTRTPRYELDDDGAPIERTVPGGFAKASQDDL